MQNNYEVQKVPAAPRRAWVTPELRALDLKGTLSGPYFLPGEYLAGDPSGDTFCNPDLGPCRELTA